MFRKLDTYFFRELIQTKKQIFVFFLIYHEEDTDTFSELTRELYWISIECISPSVVRKSSKLFCDFVIIGDLSMGFRQRGQVFLFCNFHFLIQLV